jgi:hypothetical protein
MAGHDPIAFLFQMASGNGKQLAQSSARKCSETTDYESDICTNLVLFQTDTTEKRDLRNPARLMQLIIQPIELSIQACIFCSINFGRPTFHGLTDLQISQLAT